MLDQDLAKLKALATKASRGGQHIYNNPRDDDNWQNNENYIVAAYPAHVIELIDRLQAAESNALKLKGEHESLQRHANRLAESNEQFICQRDELQSKLDDLEKQEPIYQFKKDDGCWADLCEQSYRNNKNAGHEVRIVYAKPVPAEQVRGHEIAQVVHGELGDDGCPTFAHAVTVGEFGWDNIPHGTKLYMQFEPAQAVAIPNSLQSTYDDLSESCADLSTECEKLSAALLAIKAYATKYPYDNGLHSHVIDVIAKCEVQS